MPIHRRGGKGWTLGAVLGTLFLHTSGPVRAEDTFLPRIRQAAVSSPTPSPAPAPAPPVVEELPPADGPANPSEGNGSFVPPDGDPPPGNPDGHKPGEKDAGEPTGIAPWWSRMPPIQPFPPTGTGLYVVPPSTP